MHPSNCSGVNNTHLIRLSLEGLEVVGDVLQLFFQVGTLAVRIEEKHF